MRHFAVAGIGIMHLECARRYCLTSKAWSSKQAVPICKHWRSERPLHLPGRAHPLPHCCRLPVHLDGSAVLQSGCREGTRGMGLPEA